MTWLVDQHPGCQDLFPARSELNTTVSACSHQTVNNEGSTGTLCLAGGAFDLCCLPTSYWLVLQWRTLLHDVFNSQCDCDVHACISVRFSPTKALLHHILSNHFLTCTHTHTHTHTMPFMPDEVKNQMSPFPRRKYMDQQWKHSFKLLSSEICSPYYCIMLILLIRTHPQFHSSQMRWRNRVYICTVS